MKPDDIGPETGERTEEQSGGAAFPRVYHQGWQEAHFGMSLRDYFAAKALQGLTSATNSQGDWTCGAPESVAKAAYDFADAMLKARSIPAAKSEGEPK
jgi:hypothetical protein